MDIRELRLIAFDMDGTVLAADGEVTPRLQAALCHAMERGIYVVPCTGRSRTQIPATLEELPFPFTITSNGARVRDERQGSTIYSRLVDWRTAAGLCQLVGRYDASLCVCVDEIVYFESADETFVRQEYRIPSYMKVDLTADAERLVRERCQDVEKLFVRVNEADQRAAMRREIAGWSRVACSSSSPKNLEFGESGCSKGTSLRWLCEDLGIERSQVMAFGDGENDREMLKYAGCGLAMGNALPACKEAADQVIGACREDGVAEYLENFFSMSFQ